jgi:hypothetical protein
VRSVADHRIKPIDLPLIVAPGCVVLILIMDRVLLIAAIRFRGETAASRLFAGSLFITWWHCVGWRCALIRSPQIIVQKIGRGIRLQIRRSAPPSRFIKHGLAPFLQCREPTPPQSRSSGDPMTFQP